MTINGEIMKLKKGIKKGQTYSIEMMITVILAIILIYSILNIFIILVKQTSISNKPYITLWFDSDLLLLTKGVPSDWNENPANTKIIGIASERNAIDPARLNALNQLSDQEISSLFHLDTYNVSIQVLVNGNVYFEKGNISENTSITQLERSCVFINGTPCIVKVRYSKQN